MILKECKMCGDTVEMMEVGQVWCEQCKEEHNPKDFDL